MVGIRIFVEGAGADDLSKSSLRKAFGAFFTSFVGLVRQSGGRFAWRGVVPCGKRSAAYKDFCTALEQFPDDWNILLVDSEAPLPEQCADVTRRNWEHLAKREGDQWKCPAGVDDRQCFLTVECMETWVIADKAAITKYYGAGFLANALPKNANLESVPKLTVADALKRATKPTQKGEYRKVAHGFALLQTANIQTVRAALPECDRLFRELEARIAG